MNDISILQKAIATLIAEWKRDESTSHAEIPKWILPPRSCDFLQALCRALKRPVTAFEFGSGRSTYALRTVCENVISVEDSSEWLAKTETATDAVTKGISSITGVIPLTNCWNRLRIIKSFDITSYPKLLAALEASNLILVDSPPNPAKREHALFQALNHAHVGALVIIDDLNVGTTKRFCERLSRQNRSKLLYWHLSFDHELGVFFKILSSRISSRPSLREFIASWMRVL
jgi:hypothetical protein